MVFINKAISDVNDEQAFWKRLDEIFFAFRGWKR